MPGIKIGGATRNCGAGATDRQILRGYCSAGGVINPILGQKLIRSRASQTLDPTPMVPCPRHCDLSAVAGRRCDRCVRGDSGVHCCCLPLLLASFGFHLDIGGHLSRFLPVVSDGSPPPPSPRLPAPRTPSSLLFPQVA